MSNKLDTAFSKITNEVEEISVVTIVTFKLLYDVYLVLLTLCLKTNLNDSM